MGSKANDYLESLFTGIDTLIDKKLESVSFDTTIICTITDDSNSMNGEYIVTDGSVSYTAYADVDSYLVGNQVRVSIPMGDFSQKKFIVGKYVSDNDSNPITYISPADTILSISGNLTENVKGGIVANGTDTSRVLWNQSFGNDFIAMQSNDIYNTIVLKADFRTMLSNYDLISGNYGLRLDFLVRPSAQSLVKIKRSVELDSSEMFGNPYSFSIRSPQSKIFKINTIGIIEAIELSIYQKGNFLSRNNGPIVPFVQDDNIFVDNIVLGLGCDLATTEDNKVQIYTENDTSYLYGLHNNTTNLKTIGLLWLNKDDNNQYIGFSDGIYDYDYDELDYLDKSTADARLMAQKGRENIPMDKTSLELAANIEEAVPAILNAVDVVNKDLIQVLRQFRSAVDDVISFSEHLDLLLNYTASDNNKRYLVNITDTIKTKLDNSKTGECGMVQQYADILKYGFQTWKGQTKTPTWASKASLWEVNYGADIANCFELIRTHVAWLLDTSSDGGFSGIDSAYSGYKSIYDNYKTRIERIMATMNGYLGQGDDLHKKPFPTSVFDGDYDKLMEYEDKDKTSYKLYKSPDLTAYDNKYCIYWYRYEKDYTPPVTESFMPNNWRRLTPNELKGNGDSDGINVGLSSQYKDKDGNVIKNDEGKPLHAPKPENGKGIFTRYMQNDLEQEKYIAILFYNHNMYKSNELVFTNSEVVPDKTTLDKGDILIFEHLTNSSDDFQSYSITNYLMDASDETRERQIRCHYDGLLAKDNAFINGGIYWYVPAVATMLNVDIDDLVENKGFTLDASRSKGKEWKVVNLEESNRDYIANKYYIQNANGKYVKSTSTENPGKTLYEQTYTTYCFYKQITAVKKENADNEIYEWDKWDYANGTKIDNRDFWYKIQPFYDASATNNSIKCVFIKYQEDDEVQGEQFFTFGVKGTSGTKYTLAITKPTTQKWVTASKGLSLKAQLKDFNNSLMNFGENLKNFRVEWECYKTIDRPTDIAANAAWPNTLTVQNLNTQATEANFNTHKGVYGILRASGEITLQGTEIAGESETEGRTRQVNMNVLCSVPYSSGDYYLRGPAEIIYNSLGTLDFNTMFNTPYSLLATKNLTIDGELIEKDTPIPGVVWSLVYYVKKNDGNKLADREWTILTSTDNRHKFYSQYMPKISNTNNLVPAPIYLENLDCYAVLFAKRNGTTLWRQPIIILQNRYASSMLNDWDGSLTINEKNGTILSSMVGAGRKTDNNTFEGVLMGDVALGTGSNIGFENGDNIGLSNQTGLGLYGFHDGAQSFGFNIDGTAFLGKSGTGRIIFNGNSGTIASANWYTGGQEPEDNPQDPYPRGGIIGQDGSITRSSTAGMCIDLDNGHIDAYNFKLTGSKIHFNSNPEVYDNESGITGFYMRIGNDGKTRVDYAQKSNFISDKEYAKLKTPGYLALDAQGNLTIRVNSLYITGQLGGANLLHQTEPKKTVPSILSTTEDGYVIYNRDNDGYVICTYDVANTETNKWIVGSEVAIDGNESTGPSDDKRGPSIFVKSGSHTISQTISNIKAGPYTVSGYVCRVQSTDNTQATLTITTSKGTKSEHSDNENIIKFTKNEWTYFEYTFDLTNDDLKTNKDLTISFSANVNYYLYHAKLEQGSVATAWCPSKEDVDNNTENAVDKYNKYLAQDGIFDKLSIDPATGKCMVGIWMVDGANSASGANELYISATYMATGILRSSNFDGTFECKQLTSEEIESKYGSSVAKDLKYPLYRYQLKKQPTQGVYFNLDEGKMWAATFELNAWDSANSDTVKNGNGLYLNSHPNSTTNIGKYPYYLLLGDLNSSYISFDACGNIGIKANSFYLTEALGGSNLLRQTNPKKTIPSIKKTVDGNIIYNYDSDGNIIYNYDLSQWSVNSGTSIGAGVITLNNQDYTYVKATGESGTTKGIKQTVTKLRKNKKYTISGYVLRAASSTLTSDPVLTIGITNAEPVEESNTINTVTFDKKQKEWVYFVYTFKATDTSITVLFSSSVNFLLWHAKLEEGSVATDWTESEWDLEQSIENTKDKLNNYLNQDVIFKKLTIDPKTGKSMVGIWMVDAGDNSNGSRKELYINATYIATGILRSNNWDGELEVDTIDQNLEGGKTKKVSTFKIKKEPTEGMYLNLNEGKIWAATFELDAYANEKGLYLNSHPTNNTQYYLKLGDKNNSFISFDANGVLSMKVNSLELTSTFGGINLLNDTKPRGASGNAVRNTNTAVEGAHWTYNANNIRAVVSTNNVKGQALRMYNYDPDSTAEYRAIYQDIESLTQSRKYILSGWVYMPASKQKIVFRIRPKSGSTVEPSVAYAFTANSSGWYYISHIFDIEATDELKEVNFSSPRFQITDYNLSTFKIEDGKKVVDTENYTYFYHLKLEQGTVATQWCESDIDKQDALNIYDNEQLLQDAIFNKLTNNGAAKGIFLSGGELYINATYIASSILRSSNWKATYKLKDSNGTQIKYDIDENGIKEESFNQDQLQTLLEKFPDAVIYDIDPSAGMYINLNDGKIWAKNFTLDTENVYIGSSGEGAQEIAGYSNVNPVLRMGDKFGVTADGTVYAQGGKFSGTISGSTISGSTLSGATVYASTLKAGGGDGGKEGTYILDANVNGVTISGATISGSSTENGTSYTLSSTGELTAKSAILEDLTVKTTCELLGKIHITDGNSAFMPENAQMMVSGNTIIKGRLLINSSATYKSNFIDVEDDKDVSNDYQLEIHGKTYLNNDIYIDASIGPRSIRAFGKNADKDTMLYFGKFGTSINEGIGIGFSGNKCFMYTNEIWLGKASEYSTSTTYVNGNILFNGTGIFSIGKNFTDLEKIEGLKFYLGSATGVYVGDGDNIILLSEYVKKAGGSSQSTSHKHYITLYKSSTGSLYAEQNSNGSFKPVNIYTNDTTVHKHYITLYKSSTGSLYAENINGSFQQVNITVV